MKDLLLLLLGVAGGFIAASCLWLSIFEKPQQKYCQAQRDGDCDWKECPQLRNKEPHATGRHCPLDTREDES